MIGLNCQELQNSSLTSLLISSITKLLHSSHCSVSYMYEWATCMHSCMSFPQGIQYDKRLAMMEFQLRNFQVRISWGHLIILADVFSWLDSVCALHIKLLSMLCL